MTNEKIFELISKLESDEIINKQEALGEISESANMPDNLISSVCSLLEEEDKGIQNSASMLLAINENENIPYCLVQYTSSPNIVVRNLAGEILVRIGSRAVDALLGYLDKGNNDDKKFVIDLIGLISETKGEDKIISILETTTNENLILACIETLGNINSSKCTTALFKAYEKSELFRPSVIEAFGKIGNPDTLDFMIAKYQSEEDTLIKYAIIESLANLGNEDTFFFLISELNTTEEILIAPLISTINSLKEKYSLDIPFDEKMKNSVLKTIMEGDYEYKRTAINLISDFNDKDIIFACLEIYGEDFELDEKITDKVFSNIKLIIPKYAFLLDIKRQNLNPIIKLLKNIIDELGSSAVQYFSNVDVRNLVDSLVKCLNHSDEEIRKTAMELVFKLDIESGLLFLDMMLEDENYWNKFVLIEILENINSPSAYNALLKLTSDENEMVSERAGYSISNRNEENLIINPANN